MKSAVNAVTAAWNCDSMAHVRSNGLVQKGCRDVRGFDLHVVVPRAWVRVWAGLQVPLFSCTPMCTIGPVFTRPICSLYGVWDYPVISAGLLLIRRHAFCVSFNM